MKYSTRETTTPRSTRPLRRTEPPRKSGPKRRLRKLGFCIALVLFFWYLNVGTPFVVRSVVVTTDNGLSNRQIDELFKPSDLKGMNIFYMPFENITNSFLSYPAFEDIRYSVWKPGVLKIFLTSAKPSAAMAKPWGFYTLAEDGRYIGTMPPYTNVNIPLKFFDESVLFDEVGRPVSSPWQRMLVDPDIDDSRLLMALGYRDLLMLKDLIASEGGLPDIQYIGYDSNYGLVLKCKRKPLILMGYGTEMMLHFTRARKVLLDPGFPFNENDCVDIRFEAFQCARDINSMSPLFRD